MGAITISAVSGALGGMVENIDLSQPLTAPTLRELKQALAEYEVLFFRNQEMSPSDHLRLAKHFGQPQLHEAYPHVDGHPEITILENDRENPSKIEVWHTDMTFRPCPPLGSILHGVSTPERGGDTLFASLSSAYESLSTPLKAFVEGLTAVHDFSYGFKESLAEPGGRERLKQMVEDNPPVEHPVVIEHPVTRKKALYVNALFTTHIKELRPDESKSVLSHLYQHIVLPEHCCRFSWEENSVAFWDNRITQHKPVNDYWPQHRKMQRITIDDGVRPSSAN